MTKTEQIKKIIMDNTNPMDVKKDKIADLGVHFISVFKIGKNGINPKFCAQSDVRTLIKIGFANKILAFEITADGSVLDYQ